MNIPPILYRRSQRQAPRRDSMAIFKSIAVLPYAQGMSKSSRPLPRTRHLHRLESDTTLRSHLVLPKATVNPAKQNGVVYRIPDESGLISFFIVPRTAPEAIGFRNHAFPTVQGDWPYAKPPTCRSRDCPSGF